MSSLQINQDKCNLCGSCVDTCPFGALSIVDGKIEVASSCKMCKLCIKNCPQKAITLEEKKETVDKSAWQGIMVFAEYVDHQVHPVTIELIGKAKELTAKVPMPVYVLLIGHEVGEAAEKLLKYGVDKVFVYDNKELEHYRVDTYTAVFESLINEVKPSICLVGGTSIGRSLAPRVACRFRTGLTADCTTLDIKENTDLIQIRPAFGGNIMAQIVTPYTRPQFATVRYKVMNRAKKVEPNGEIVHKTVTDNMVTSSIKVLKAIKKQQVPSITEADVLVVAGQGVKSKDDLGMVEKLADLLGGQVAATRPLIENGWCDYTRQIGLSGRTVKPRLIITCGVAGAIQFTACMNQADCIVAINTDKDAPIFEIAHYGVVGDLYTVIPQLIEKIEGGSYAL